jgi:hypothetical protein
MSIRDQYVREVSSQFGYLATWAPNLPIKLGQVGLLRDRVFLPRTDLQTLGVTAGVPLTSPGPADISFSSATGVSVSFKAEGAASLPGSSIPQAKAGITVEFSRKASTLFELSGTTISVFQNIEQVGNDIKRLYDADRSKWDTDWIAIVEVVEAKSGTILISSEDNAKIEFSIGAQVDAASIKLSDANLGLAISSFRNLSTRVVASSGLTPLYRAIRLNRGFFGDTDIGPASPRALSRAPSIQAVAVGSLWLQPND